nr:dTDP-glucose 4,6-dehydratase [Phascolarctobacterium succinatutens]
MHLKFPLEVLLINIIVTGGAGFIGSNFIFYMLAKHPAYRIICLDKLTYAGNRSTLEPVMKNSNFRFVQADICDREAVDKLFEEEYPDIVVNFAAESHVDRSIENPEIFLQTNIIGAATLMDVCRKYGIRRYHQISTDEVYGDLTLCADAKPFTEKALIRPSSPYSSSKASADLLVMAYHRTYGLPVSISRCSNNYGPYQFPEKLIPLMLVNALADKPLPVYGEGLNVRDWLYVEDHCKAIDLIIHKGRVGEIYNIGGNDEMRNIDIVKLICKELGKPESLITHVTDRKGHDMRYAIDPTKIHNELCWLPETKFADGIKKTIKWYLENQKWWKDIINGEYQNYYDKMYENR